MKRVKRGGPSGFKLCLIFEMAALKITEVSLTLLLFVELKNTNTEEYRITLKIMCLKKS